MTLVYDRRVASRVATNDDSDDGNCTANRRPPPPTRVSLRSAARRRRSMDRFGDDLCQHLLSYLTFEELFRYECVCRQWQRLVFTRQRVLKIEYNWTSVFLPTRAGLVFARNQSILRKCRSVQDISINKFVNNRDEVFAVINKYCHHLSSIESDFDGLSAATVRRFCQLFATKVRNVCFHSDNDTNRQVFRCLAANVNAVDIKAFNDLSFVFKITGADDNEEVLVDRLRHISFTYSNEDQRRIQVLCDRNQRTLRSIDVLFSANPLTQKSVNSLFRSLATLHELRSLVIAGHSEIDDSLGSSLELIARRCPSLKKMDITLSKSHYDITGPALHQSLTGLPQLRRLSLKLHFHSPDTTNGHEMRATAAALRDCRRLTHLRIISNHCLITDEFFDAIDGHLPRLQVLELWSVDITDRAFEAMARLTRLRSAYLVCLKSSARVNAAAVQQVMDKCPKIKSIYFRNHSYCLEFKN